jgi:hypothetical protein
LVRCASSAREPLRQRFASLASGALPLLAMDNEKLLENLRNLEAEALGLPATADRSARKEAIERLRASTRSTDPVVIH